MMTKRLHNKTNYTNLTKLDESVDSSPTFLFLKVFGFFKIKC